MARYQRQSLGNYYTLSKAWRWGIRLELRHQHVFFLICSVNNLTEGRPVTDTRIN